MSPRRHTREEWIELCREAEESALSGRAFARSRGIHPSSLTWWRSKLRSEGILSKPTGAFVEIREAKAPSIASSTVSVTSQTSGESHVVVQVGMVSIAFGKTPPPVDWISELVARC